MRIRFILFSILLLHIVIGCIAQKKQITATSFFPADHPYIQYTGRIDFTHPQKPIFWQPGVYIKAAFLGTFCYLIVNDEVLWGNNHNYIEVVIDDTILHRVQTKSKTDTIKIATGLRNGPHTIILCKNTEAGIGYLAFDGLLCSQLLPLPPQPDKKIEFIGNSITCGMGSDLSQVPCNKGQWYDQHNAYLSYGPLTARALNAQWMLSSVSGIGLIHSCCNMDITMPQVYDKVNMRIDSIKWNFSKYTPDAVAICLGQNDGIQDSAKFANAYVQFIQTIRSHYPQAAIICLTSPMADSALRAYMEKSLTGIVNYLHKNGDDKVYRYFFSKRYHHGCGDHPDLQEHKQIADELTVYLKRVLHW